MIPNRGQIIKLFSGPTYEVFIKKRPGTMGRNDRFIQIKFKQFIDFELEDPKIINRDTGKDITHKFEVIIKTTEKDNDRKPEQSN